MINRRIGIIYVQEKYQNYKKNIPTMFFFPFKVVNSNPIFQRD